MKQKTKEEVFNLVKNYIIRCQDERFCKYKIAKELSLYEKTEIDYIEQALETLIQSPDDLEYPLCRCEDNPEQFFFKIKLIGVFKQSAKLYGRVFLKDKSKGLKIPNHLKGNAQDGDTVIAEIIKPGNNASGRIIQILKTGEAEFDALLVGNIVYPLDQRLKELSGKVENSEDFRDYDLVHVKQKNGLCYIEERFSSQNLTNKNILDILEEENIAIHYSRKEIMKAKEIYIKPEMFIGREDLRTIPTFTIDYAGIKDFNNALSVIFDNTITHVYVHIADVSAFIKKMSYLDKQAIKRGETFYTLDGNISVFPEILSENIFSFSEGKDRLALTFVLDFNESFELINYSLKTSIINVDENITYQKADHIISNLEDSVFEKEIKRLYEIACILRKNRKDKGALILEMPTYSLRRKNSQIEVTRNLAYQSNSYILIEEIMILINIIAAKRIAQYFNDGIGIYRCQPNPDKLSFLNDWLSLINEEKIKGPYDFKKRFKMLDSESYHEIKFAKSIAKMRYSAQKENHFVLGLPFYMTVTFPIRRYGDLVSQRYLKETLRRKVTMKNSRDLTLKQVSRLNMVSERLEKARQRVKNYYLMKSAESLSTDKVYKALVCKVKKNKIYIELENGITGFLCINESRNRYYDHRGALVSLSGEILIKEGDRIKVRIKQISEQNIEFSIDEDSSPVQSYVNSGSIEDELHLDVLFSNGKYFCP